MANDGYDGVQIIQSNGQAFQHVSPIFRLAKLKLGSPSDNFVPVIDIMADHLLQIESSRSAMNQRNNVHPECVLELRVLVELILHDQRQGIAFEFDNDAHSVAIGLVTEIGNAFDLFISREHGDFFYQRAFVYLVWDFCRDEGISTRANLFFVKLAAHHNPTAAGVISLAHFGVPVYDTAGWEIRGGHDVYELIYGDVNVVDVGYGRRDHLPRVMGWNLGSHSDRNAVRSVDEKIGNSSRQHLWFLQGSVEVILKIDGVLAEIPQHFLGNPGHSGLRIPHCRSTVSIHRAEVSLSIDEGTSHGKILGHANHGIVNR